jgi:ribosome hibernation promoting factor
MKIEVRGRGFRVTQALREHLEKRLRFALDRVAPRVEAVTGVLRDVNGPRGGVDKHCEMRARLLGAREVRVRERDHDLYRAIARAAGALGRGVVRELKLQQRARLHQRA